MIWNTKHFCSYIFGWCKHLHQQIKETSFACPRLCRGVGFTFIKMTWYANDRDIKFGTLLKEGSLHSPSFTKVLHPIFFYFGTLMQSGLLYSPSCTKVLHPIFFIFGTLMQSGSLRSPSCTKVLHPIFYFLYFDAVRFASLTFLHQSTSFYLFIFGTLSQVHFTHLPTPKYCILFFYFWYFDAVRLTLLSFLHQSTASYF